MTFQDEYQQSDFEEKDIVTGIVRIIDIKGSVALVEPENKSGCESCAMAKGCGTKMLSGYFSRNMKPIRLQNDFDGKIGDRLKVGMENATILKLSAITYLFPLVGMTLAVMAAGLLQVSNISILFLSLIGLWGGFLLAQKMFSSSYITRSVEFIFLGKLSSSRENFPSSSEYNECMQ